MAAKAEDELGAGSPVLLSTTDSDPFMNRHRSIYPSEALLALHLVNMLAKRCRFDPMSMGSVPPFSAQTFSMTSEVESSILSPAAGSAYSSMMSEEIEMVPLPFDPALPPEAGPREADPSHRDDRDQSPGQLTWETSGTDINNAMKQEQAQALALANKESQANGHIFGQSPYLPKAKQEAVIGWVILSDQRRRKDQKIKSIISLFLQNLKKG